MSDVIDLNSRRPPPNPGNGAREALIEIGKDCPFHVQDNLAAYWSDDVLIRLWERGFKVVPIEEKDLR